MVRTLSSRQWIFLDLQCSDYWKIHFVKLIPGHDRIISPPHVNSPSINLSPKIYRPWKVLLGKNSLPPHTLGIGDTIKGFYLKVINFKEFTVDSINYLGWELGTEFEIALIYKCQLFFFLNEKNKIFQDAKKSTLCCITFQLSPGYNYVKDLNSE